jgi:hypothetical protein
MAYQMKSCNLNKLTITAVYCSFSKDEMFINLHCIMLAVYCSFNPFIAVLQTEVCVVSCSGLKWRKINQKTVYHSFVPTAVKLYCECQF